MKRKIAYGLPEDEEYNKLDGKELEEGLIILDVVADLVIELDEVEHGYRNGDCCYNFGL